MYLELPAAERQRAQTAFAEFVAAPFANERVATMFKQMEIKDVAPDSGRRVDRIGQAAGRRRRRERKVQRDQRDAAREDSPRAGASPISGKARRSLRSGRRW
jgi:hypothetical protein